MSELFMAQMLAHIKDLTAASARVEAKAAAANVKAGAAEAMAVVAANDTAKYQEAQAVAADLFRSQTHTRVDKIELMLATRSSMTGSRLVDRR